MNKQSERLSMDFEITPEKGIELQPLPQMGEEPVPEEEEKEQETTEQEATEEPEQEAAESQTEEPETEVEEQSQGLNMSIGQFANAAGVTLKDIYGITMPDGRTLSQAVDEGKEQQAVVGRLQTENSQLKEQLQKAQNNYVPMDDPEALALEKEAEVYQKALDNADWSQVDPGQAANQKLEYMRVIDQLKNAANVKRQENAIKQRDASQQAIMAANQELLKHIPEWNNPEVYSKDNRDMGNFLINEGFTPQDLQAFDRYPVAKKFIYKAWKAMATQKQIEKGVKKVRKITRSLAPGAAATGTSKSKSMNEVGKAIRQAKTARERQQIRLNTDFQRQ